MTDILTKHSGVIAAVIVSALGWAFNAGMYSHKLTTLESVVEVNKQNIQKLDITSNGALQTKWVVDQHERMLSEHSNELRKVISDIGEIKTDIRLIAEWVRQQKEKHPNE